MINIDDTLLEDQLGLLPKNRTSKTSCLLNPANRSSSGRATLDNKTHVWIMELLVFQTHCHVNTQRESIHLCSRDGLLTVKWHWPLPLCSYFQRLKDVLQLDEPLFKNFLITGAFVLALIGGAAAVREAAKLLKGVFWEAFPHMTGHEFGAGTWFWSSDLISAGPCSRCEASADQWKRLCSKMNLIQYVQIQRISSLHLVYWSRTGVTNKDLKSPAGVF